MSHPEKRHHMQLTTLIAIALTSCAENSSIEAKRSGEKERGNSQTSDTTLPSGVNPLIPNAASIEPKIDIQPGLLLTPSSRVVSSVNLAKYFPKSTTQQRYRDGWGNLYSTYTYLYNSSTFTGLYNQYFNLQKPGFLGTWSKHYAGAPQPATYAQIYFGSDGSTTEVGDYLNTGAQTNYEFVLFGYRSPATYSVTGLSWANPGGSIQRTSVVHPYTQGRAGQAFVFKETDKAVLAYAYVWAEELDSFQLNFGMKNGTWAKGNGKSFSNVLHLVFYHGTNQGNVSVNCSSKAGNYLKGFYSKVPGFGSYVSEYYLAEGKWIIQERTLYIEDATYWRNLGQDMSDCSGAAFEESADGSYGAKYLE